MAQEEQIRFTLDSSLKKEFQRRCLDLDTKMATVLRDLVDSWLKDTAAILEPKSGVQDADNKQQPVNKDKISNFFRSLEEGKQPTKAEIVKIANLLQIKTDSLIAICDCFEEKVRNG